MMKFFISLAILFSTFVNSQKKINGISFVASNRIVSEKEIKPVIKINANWVTLMPFAFLKTETNTNIVYDDERQWWGERKIGVEQTAALFHNQAIKVMIKPQIWIPNGFTGNIKMKSEKDWQILENNYQKFILEYALLAQKTNCEMFCIGTELNKFVNARPDFWNQLIKKIRLIYNGKITYAENWDKFQNVPFIKYLDFIGIDAYFPLSDQKTPDIDSLSIAWVPIKSQIKKLSKKFNKPILFTEFGYQSKDFTAKEPWNHSQQADVNLVAQQNALAVVLATFWKEKWFAGGFLWKWYDNYEQVGGSKDSDYTIQNKPAELVLEKFYKE
ncbi:MAG: glycoside hydrolase [Flavobacterium sp.]|nr:glycoside hydrolase [Flavobacterium sp.]